MLWRTKSFNLPMIFWWQDLDQNWQGVLRGKIVRVVILCWWVKVESSDFWTILGASGVTWCKTFLGFIVERSGNFSNMIFVLQIAGCPFKSMRSRQFGYIYPTGMCVKKTGDGWLRSRLCRNSWTLLSFRQRSVWHFFFGGGWRRMIGW